MPRPGFFMTNAAVRHARGSVALTGAPLRHVRVERAAGCAIRDGNQDFRWHAELGNEIAVLYRPASAIDERFQLNRAAASYNRCVEAKECRPKPRNDLRGERLAFCETH